MLFRSAEKGYVIHGIRDTEAWNSLKEGMKRLRILRNNRDFMSQEIWRRKNGIRDEDIPNPARSLEEAEEEIHRLEYRLEPLMNALNPAMIPLTDTLYYNYDFGDDWLIRITCVDSYTRADKIADPLLYIPEDRNLKELKEKGFGEDFTAERIYVDRNGKKAGKVVRRAVSRAEMEKMSTCILAEGLPPVEDVGGIHGYFDFIRKIHTPDDEEAASYREWARGQGWKGIVGKPESLL